jgi:hypothetical protein
MTIVIFTMSSRLECKNETSSSSQMIESKDSQSKRIRKIKKTIHSNEKLNKKMFFKFNEFIV